MSLPIRSSEFSTAPRPAGEFRISLLLSVTDSEALWDAASARAYATIPDATAEDIDEMIGPREDPAVTDCIALLTGPAAIPGCIVADFRVEDRYSR